MVKLTTTLVAIVLAAGVANAQSVAITSPANGSLQSGTIAVTASNNPSTDYNKWYGPKLSSGACASPFSAEGSNCVFYDAGNQSFNFNTGQLANGPSGFYVQEFTPSNQLDAAAQSNYTIGTPTPTPTPTPTVCAVAFTAPQQGAVISGTVTATVSVSGCGSDYTKWYLPDGSNVYGPASVTFDTTKVKNGASSFGVQMFTQQQRYTGVSAGIGVTIQNGAPSPTPTATGTPTPTATATGTPTPTGTPTGTPTPTATGTPSPSKTPTPTPTATPIPAGQPQVVSVNDARNMWCIDTKMIQDSGAGASAFTQITNTYANAIAYGGWRCIRDDATHAGTGAQQILVNAVTMASQFEGAPVLVDELPAVDDNTTPSPSCVVSPSNPYCGGLADTQYEWDFLAKAGVAGPFLELFNEPNNFGFTYLTQACGSSTYSGCVTAAKDIYAMAKADPLLANFPIVGMSEPGAEPDAVGAPNMIGTGYDWFNFHNYYDTATIGNGQLRVDNQIFNALSMFPTNVGQDSWGNYEGDAANGFTTWGSAHEPITVHDNVVGQFGGPTKVTTETGMNVYQCFNGSPAQTCISSYSEGLGHIFVYLDGIIQGNRYTYVYQMMNNRTNDGGWGYFNSNPAVDGVSFNPSVMAGETNATDWSNSAYGGALMHNMTSILADTVSINPTMPTGYSVSGGSATTHSILMQYSASGQFPNAHVAVVWDESFGGTKSTATVNFGSAVNYTVYDAINGLTADSNGNASSVQVTVSGNLAPVFVVF